MLARAALLAGCLLLSGCSAKTPANSATAGTAESSAPAATQADTADGPNAGVDTHSAQAARAGLPVVIAFGDSLTAGRSLDPGQSYPDFLQKDLDADGYHVRVVNMGVSGDTTKDGLARLQDALAEKPALVIVGFGGNDGLRGIGTPEIEDNLGAMVRAFQRQHAAVVLGGITLPPNYGVGYVDKFNAVYPALAAKYHVPLLPFMLQDVWDKPGMLQSDGIHPTAIGAVQVAKNFVPLVEPLLKKN